MNAIVSVTSDWAIGNKGRLVVANRADMRRFKELTMGGTVIMGRATFESFPNGPLAGRRNVVVTHDASYGHDHQGIVCAASPQEALAMVAGDNPDRVWLIGGESLYRALLPECERAYVTKNDTTVEADAFFPNLDADDGWQVEERGDGGVTAAGIPFEYVVYRNVGNDNDR
ncbi:MAG: dihydrofolate reductase [Atopobiaceae bacterium]|nr:dihydrofolate reductase [Atopobiaceae bacterium]